MGKTTRTGGRIEHAHDKRGQLHQLLTSAGHALKAKKTDEAWEYAMAALSRDMDSAGACYIVGQIALENDYPGLAANMLRRACALRPDVYSNWLGFGAALLDMRHFEEAEECFRKAIRIKPDEPTGYANMSALELNRGRPRECIEWCDKSLAILDHVAVRGNKGFALLMLKQWKEGFDLYRGSMAGKHRIRRIYKQPEEAEWDGEHGQTVVVQCEQGLGDEISYASCIPDLAAVSKKVILDAHPKLYEIFKRSFPQCDVYPTRKARVVEWPHQYEIDASVPMSFLPHHFRNEDKDFPRAPWLKCNDELRAKWREWLDALPGTKIGIAWTGGIFLTNREGRSATLAEFDPLIPREGTAISLEYRDEDEAVKAWNEAHPDRKVIIPPVDRDNYDDTLALLAELDLVASVTTTIIHACGAIGRQCFCIVPSVLTSSQWRYGIDGDEMIWYPRGSVQLFRQRRNENGLSMVIARVADEIKKALREKVAA